MYRNSALSAAGAMMCECIQREWANLQVKQNELLIQMMLYRINTLKSRGDGQKMSDYLLYWANRQLQLFYVESTRPVPPDPDPNPTKKLGLENSRIGYLLREIANPREFSNPNFFIGLGSESVQNEANRAQRKFMMTLRDVSSQKRA
jgi:hypothetical protein